MAANIEERIVAMSFENAQFEQRINTTLTSLGKLDTTLKNMHGAEGLENIEKAGNKVSLKGPMSALDALRSKLGRSGEGAAEGLGQIEKAGNKVTLEQPNKAIDQTQAKLNQLNAGETFSNIEKASDRVELSGITRAIENVGSKFGFLEHTAANALGGIVTNATMKGAAFAKSFAFGPITDGLNEYKTNLNSIQTILANTEGQQVSGLSEVNKHLDELNTYSDQTIYNFSEMAKNIGTFTAAGVDLDTSTQSIKGIANLAALSGSNSQQASTAMYQLSQAIASGKVGLQDWNSVVNAGMGGAVFQKALARTADNMGALEKGALKIDKATGKATINGESFRESIMAKPGQQSWLTSEVLTTTLKNFTGDMKEADLIAQGFDKTQAQAIMKQAATAKAAATEVKTLSQAFDVAKETIGSGWSATFKNIFGDFEESKKTFTSFSNGLNAFLNKTSDARNNLLKGWHDLGGRDMLFQGLEDAIKGLTTIFKPIHEAFREIFPPTTAKQLLDMTKRFADFAKSIAIDPSTADKIKRTFAGIFAVFSIAKEILGGVISVIGDLLGAVGEGGDGFLDFTAGIGDFLVNLNEAIKKGDALEKFFDRLSGVLQKPVQFIGYLARALGDLFGAGDKNSVLADKVGEVVIVLSPLDKMIITAKNAWMKLVGAFGAAKDALEPWFSAFVGTLSTIGQTIVDAFKSLSFDDVLKGIQTGLLGGIFLLIKQAFGSGGGLIDEISKTLGSLQGVLGGVTNNLENMQKKVQAQLILSIAAAVVALAGGVYILSTIDGDKLAKAMTAVAVGLGELMGAMKLMTLGLGKTGALMLPLIAAGIIGLAIAMNILALAMKIFASMSLSEIGKGMLGVGGALIIISDALKLMPKSPLIILQATALLILGAALNAIAFAIKTIGQMHWDDIKQGLIGIGTALGIIAVAMNLMPPSMVLTATAIGILSTALVTLSGAMKLMGMIDLMTMAKGLLGITTALLAIAAAMNLMPPHMVLTAGALFIVANAMIVLGKAIEIMGSMGMATIAKGLGTMAAALIILAGGLTLMIATLPGSAALLAAAGALAILAPTLGLLGTMKWSTIFKGLAAIGLALVTVGIAGVVATPALIGLGVAMIPLGLGFMLVATAAKIFASALALLSDKGTKGLSVLIASMTAFVAIIPTVLVGFIKGMVGVIEEVTKVAPKVVEALTKIVELLLDSMIKNAPKFAQLFTELIDLMIVNMTDNGPRLIEAGFKLLVALLEGISKNISRVVSTAGDIVTKFLTALAGKIPNIVRAGADVVASYLKGLAQNIGKVLTAGADLIGKFIKGLAQGYAKIIGSGVDAVLKFIEGIASKLVDVVGAGARLVIKFIAGLGQKGAEVAAAGVSMIIKFIESVGKQAIRLGKEGANAVINFVNGVADAIRQEDTGRRLGAAGANLARAIIAGMAGAFDELSGGVIGKLVGIATKGLNAVKRVLGVHSPSTEFAAIGRFAMLGLSKGLDDNQNGVVNSSEKSGQSVINAFRNVLGIHSPSEVMREIGMQVNRGFKEGLEGSIEDVNSAFSSLNDKLRENIRSAKETIASEQEKLTELLRAEEPDYKAIDAARKSIAENEKLLATSRATRTLLIKDLADEKDQLIGLKTAYDDVTLKLEDATKVLEDAKKTRDDAEQSFQQKYSSTPDIGEVSKEKTAAQVLADYKKSLADRIVATKSYAETLQKLRALGLDDTTYKKLLEEGVEGKDFAEQLLAGGKTAVDGMNALDAQLIAASTTLASDASKNLYDAGVAAAQGLVNGLAARKGELEKQMEDIAQAMVKAIKKQLKIKSPSVVMAEVGKFAAEGVIQGLKGSSNAVANAAEDIGNEAASAMTDTLSRISDTLGAEIDPDLTLTPVLDLTQVKNDAQKLKQFLVDPKLAASASYGQAAAISVARQTEQATATDTVMAPAPVTEVKFEQNNYSPESLSTAEIYRKTQNQLSQVKNGLGLLPTG